MKNYISISLLLLMYSFNNFGQDNELLEDLQCDESYRNITATYVIIDKRLEEFYPFINELYENKPLEVKSIFLQALYLFNDPDIETKVDLFIQSINNATPDELNGLDPLMEKINASKILFWKGDYDNINLVFELINRDGTENISSMILDLLNFIIKYVPDYENQAKNLLLLFCNNTNSKIRFLSMDYLTEKYGLEMIGRLNNSFLNDLDRSVKMLSLKHLIKLDKQNLENKLLEQIIQAQDWTVRTVMVDTLFIHFGFPTDLKSVIDYLPLEPNLDAYEYIGNAIQFFIPPRPTVTTAQMIENLISYNAELLQYSWITEYSTFVSFNRLLEKVQESYSSKSLEDLCYNLNRIIANAEELRGGPLLTEEGYKFLFYHATYIKENVQSELGACEEREK